jgi:hypothetical protein
VDGQEEHQRRAGRLLIADFRLKQQSRWKYPAALFISVAGGGTVLAESVFSKWWHGRRAGFRQRASIAGDPQKTKPGRVALRFRAGRPKQQARGLCHPVVFWRSAPATDFERTSQPDLASTLKISPDWHSTSTSNGRQQTSQSVVKHCRARLVSTGTANDWPQNVHWMSANSSMLGI